MDDAKHERLRMERKLAQALADEVDAASRVSALQEQAEEMGIDVQALRAEAGLV